MLKLLPTKTISSIENLKFRDEIEDEALQDLPLGQAMLRAGFKRITPREIEKKLNMDEINAGETAGAYNLALKYRDGLMEKASWFEKKANPPELEERIVGHVRVRERWFSYKIYRPFPVPLESYSEEVIPDDCLYKINQAKALGIKNFFVVQLYDQNQPLVGRDPIIIACVGTPLMGWSNPLYAPVSWFEIASWE